MSPSELAGLKDLDHQRRNYFLRTQLVKKVSLAENFIMSDDDARPLKNVSLERFIKDEKHHSYYFYDLRRWEYNLTEFDAGQISTRAILDHCGLPQLAYASHMPQIINRDLFLRAADFFKPFGENYPICEWASYFNFAHATMPSLFHQPQPYTTLCWPEHPLAWRRFVEPEEFLFENFTPQLYSSGQPFNGLVKDNENQSSASLLAIEKVARWQKHSIALYHPEQSKNPLKYFHPRTWSNKFFNR
jgi:hypothetical protein